MEYNFSSFFETIINEHGRPQYVIGVTFGVDLDKWRTIQKTIFKEEYSDRIPFDRAFLFTDKVYIKDTNPNRDLYKGNLLYAIPSVDGYLHTKFVLLCYGEKYVLVMSTKNINGNNSYDCILPLVFSRGNEESLHGRKVKNYLEYLIKQTTNYEIPKSLITSIAPLDQFQIVSSLSGFEVGDFEFAYGKNRFTDELWEKVSASQEIVSPYLDKDIIDSLTDSKKILSYPEQIAKVEENKVHSNISYRVGKGNYENKCLIAQRKYHAKLYFYWDKEKNKGRMIVGSANLTAFARNKHCEMLVELVTSCKSTYEEREAFFNDDDWTEAYRKDIDYTPLVDGEEINDEEPMSVIGDEDSIYVKQDHKSGVFEVHLVKNSNTENATDIIWGAGYTKASFYVIYEGQMLLIDENRYIQNIDNYTDALSYEAYAKLIDENKQRLQKESDSAVLTGRKGATYSTRTGRKEKEGRGLIVEDIPCLFETIFQKLEGKRNRNNNITAQQIFDALSEIRNSLFDQNLVSQIDLIINDLEHKDE